MKEVKRERRKKNVILKQQSEQVFQAFDVWHMIYGLWYILFHVVVPRCVNGAANAEQFREEMYVEMLNNFILIQVYLYCDQRLTCTEL